MESQHLRFLIAGEALCYAGAAGACFRLWRAPEGRALQVAAFFAALAFTLKFVRVSIELLRAS